MKQNDILIIDDEQKFADMLAKRLFLRGFSAKVCYDGRTGIETFFENDFKIVLLDLRLPDMNGEDVLMHIMEKGPVTPVIIITGHGSENDRISCMGKGAFAFMQKPIQIDGLTDLLKTIQTKSI